MYDDIAYGDSLGRTAKFPRNSLAFKWTDETADTTLRQIEWSASRTGLINPVAIFDTVELEGTRVSRASVHNISVMEGLKLGIGDTIQVFKANMIIPQIAANLTQSSNIQIPDVCPVCGGPTQIKQLNDVKSLYCVNPECQAKHVKSFAHFVSRDAMNIDGLSEATLEKFIQKGFLKTFKDYGLGIANVGLSNAKMIVKQLKSVDNIINCTRQELEAIDGVGAVIADTFAAYFEDEDNKKNFMELLRELDIEKEDESTAANILDGKIFVITGSLNHFGNRSELKEMIEKLGGKATGSVTGKTSYLINNDSTSSSSKNKTAAKLGVPVITEEEFLNLAGIKDM